MDNRTFVSDSLLRLTGASEPTIVDFVLATASSTKSATSLQDKLVSFLDGSPDEVSAFCRDLHARTNAGAAASATRSGPKKESKDVSSKKKYRLVDMGDDMPDPASSLGPANIEADRERRKRKEKDSQSSRGKEDREERSRWEKDESRKRERSRDDASSRDRHRSKKLRRRDDDFEDRWGDEEIPEEYEEEEGAEQGDFGESPAKRTRLEDGSASPRSNASADLDPQVKQETDRQKDLKERDEFAKRLANKDDSKTKKIVEDRTRSGEAARRRALGDDASSRAAAMPELRMRSRQEYLKKRETERLALLR